MVVPSSSFPVTAMKSVDCKDSAFRNFSKDVKAAHVRQAQIKQHDRWSQANCLGDSCLAIVGDFDFVAAQFQQCFERFAGILRVVNHQDMARI